MNVHEWCDKYIDLLKSEIKVLENEIRALKKNRADVITVAALENAALQAELVKAEHVLEHLGSWCDQQGHFHDLTNPEAQIQTIIDALEQATKKLAVKRARLTWALKFPCLFTRTDIDAAKEVRR